MGEPRSVHGRRGGRNGAEGGADLGRCSSGNRLRLGRQAWQGCFRQLVGRYRYPELRRAELLLLWATREMNGSFRTLYSMACNTVWGTYEQPGTAKTASLRVLLNCHYDSPWSLGLKIQLSDTVNRGHEARLGRQSGGSTSSCHTTSTRFIRRRRNRGCIWNSLPFCRAIIIIIITC